MLSLSPAVQIPLTEFSFSFARSGGPGGQNVNKVSSKAILRWAVAASPSLPAQVRARFLTKYTNRLTVDGDLILTSQRYREQSRNIDDCLEKLKEMIAAVLTPPVPRRRTKASRASKERLSQSKRAHSQKKQRRRSPGVED